MKKKVLVLEGWPCSDCGDPCRAVQKPGIIVEWCEPCAARRVNAERAGRIIGAIRDRILHDGAAQSVIDSAMGAVVDQIMHAESAIAARWRS